MADMNERRTWDEFRECGLLWWVNRGLHLFGWAIVLEIDGGKAVDVYPIRCEYRGFMRNDEEEGFERLTAHLSENIERLKSDVED